MKKKLTKHGNSLALIIDRPILELLGINEKTSLEISIVNDAIVVKSKSRNSKTRKREEAEMDEIAKRIMHKYAPVFKKLSKT